jgi:hypothetical protein
MQLLGMFAQSLQSFLNSADWTSWGFWIVLSEFARVLLILFETFSDFLIDFRKIDVDLKYFFGTFCLIPKCLFWKLKIVVNCFSAFSLRFWVLISYIYCYSVDLNVIELNFFWKFCWSNPPFFLEFQLSKFSDFKTWFLENVCLE